MCNKDFKELREKYKKILRNSIEVNGTTNVRFLVEEVLNRLFDEIIKDYEKYR